MNVLQPAIEIPEHRHEYGSVTWGGPVILDIVQRSHRV